MWVFLGGFGLFFVGGGRGGGVLFYKKIKKYKYEF